MKKMLRNLLIVTFLLSTVLTHNAFAEQLSIGVTPKWTNWDASWQFYNNICSSGSWCWGVNSANTILAQDGVRVKQIRFNLPNGIILGRGDYIVAEMVYNLETQNNSNDMIFGSMKSNTSGIGLIDVTVNRGSNAMGSIKFTFKVENTIRVTNTTTYVQIATARGNIDQYNIFWFNENAGYLQGSVVNFYETKSETDYSGALSGLSTGITNLNSKLNTTNQKLDDVKNEIKKGNDKDDQDRQDLQDSQDDLDNTGQDASDDAANATQSLLTIIGQFVTAVTTASPTNCKINGNMGNLDVGEMDLCSNPVPTYMQIIGSIIAVLVIIPLCIVMFNRFVGIVRSFQD